MTVPHVAAVFLAILLAGCSGLGAGGDDVPSTWDLREDPTVDVVGWPEDDEGRSRTIRDVPDDLEVLLPEETRLAVGAWEPERVEVARLFEPGARAVTSIGVVLPPAPPPDTLQRAAELAEQLELDDAAIREWGARPTREGGSVTSPPRDLSGPRGDWSIQLTLLPGGDADDPHARLTVLLVSRNAADADR